MCMCVLVPILHISLFYLYALHTFRPSTVFCTPSTIITTAPFHPSPPPLPSTPPLPLVLRSQIQCPSPTESTADPQAPPIGGATRSGEDHFGGCPGQGQWAQLDKDMFVGTDCECMCVCTYICTVCIYVCTMYSVCMCECTVCVCVDIIYVQCMYTCTVMYCTCIQYVCVYTVQLYMYILYVSVLMYVYTSGLCGHLCRTSQSCSAVTCQMRPATLSGSLGGTAPSSER